MTRKGEASTPQSWGQKNFLKINLSIMIGRFWGILRVLLQKYRRKWQKRG
jgi:hypothetical protein